MQTFLSQNIEKGVFELEIDIAIFDQDIILRSSFTFLDKGYFLFKRDGGNIIVQCRAKRESIFDTEKILLEYSDSLLEMTLRDKLERDNKIIRETIVTRAINGPFDAQNFVTLDTDKIQKQNEIDLDKDIDEILREIRNDPDLKIDEGEIERILAEIEEDSRSDLKKPEIVLNTDSISAVKSMFKNKK